MKRRHKTKSPVFDKEGYQTNLKDLNGTPLPDLSKVHTKSLRDAVRRSSDPTFAFWNNPEDAVYDRWPEDRQRPS